MHGVSCMGGYWSVGAWSSCAATAKASGGEPTAGCAACRTAVTPPALCLTSLFFAPLPPSPPACSLVMPRSANALYVVTSDKHSVVFKAPSRPRVRVRQGLALGCFGGGLSGDLRCCTLPVSFRYVEHLLPG